MDWWLRWPMYSSRPASTSSPSPQVLALAKMSGVILAHPGLTLNIAGYTDSTGGDQFNLKLSGQRADAVRTFLVQQGLNPARSLPWGWDPLIQ